MNKILYSICSTSHLSYFKTMAASFINHNNDYKIYLFLVDKFDKNFDLQLDNTYTIIEIDNIGIENFHKICKRYNLLELSCSMKPFAAYYLLNKYNPNVLLYLDTDILVYDNFSYAEDLLLENDIVLTPHIFSEINDNKLPKETDYLNAGIFNAGFFMLKNTSNVLTFLNWWKSRMEDQCQIDYVNGKMLDQIWLNFVPYFYDKVIVCNHLGYNFAYWNFHERNLSLVNSSYFINNSYPLIFIHISGFDIDNPENLSKHQNRFNLENLKLISNIYREYVIALNNNNYDYYKSINSFYINKTKKPLGIIKILNKILKLFNFKLINLN